MERSKRVVFTPNSFSRIEADGDHERGQIKGLLKKLYFSIIFKNLCILLGTRGYSPLGVMETT